MKPFLLITLILTATVLAQSAQPIEKVVGNAMLIVHCRAIKGPESVEKLAVVEVLKGAYKPELFVPTPPQGFIIPQGDAAKADGDLLLVYTADSQAAGKFQRHDLLLPIAGGKVRYPADARPGVAQREYSLTELKAIAQNSLRFPLLNGGFDDSPVGSEPAGWMPAYPSGAGVVAQEGTETFLRFSSATGANAGMAQQVVVPPGSRTILVMGRMRGKPRNAKEEKRAAVEVALRYLDAKGLMINAAVLATENSANWRTFRREATLPPGCSRVEVVARSIFAVGTFDFDAVRVEFK
jgi:hypothetical protein